MAAPKPKDLGGIDVSKIPAKSGHKSGLASAVAPVVNPKQRGATIDQGVDYSQDTPYVAVGDGTVVRVRPAGAFVGHGEAIYYRLKTPVTVNGRTYSVLYIAGQAGTTALVKEGDPVVAGQGLIPAGSAELGFAKDDASAPAGPLVGGFNARGGKTVATQAGADFYTFASGANLPLSPTQKAAAAAADASAKAASPTYIQATTDLATVKAQALASAQATAHVSDPWITVTKKGSTVTGFGEAMTPDAPANVLLIGGVPATKSLFQQQWGATYANVFADYTGRNPSAAEQADILTRGMSSYALREELSKQPAFKASPAYKQSGAGIAQQAKDVLGTKPPDEFVRKAISQNWDAATVDANLRALPQYTKGPVFQKALTGATDVYTAIYGKPSVEDHGWLKQAALAGWDQGTVASKLRSSDAYKFSGEYETNVMGFLDKMGLLIGAQPALSPVRAPAGTPQAPTGKLKPTVLGLTPTLEKV